MDEAACRHVLDDSAHLPDYSSGCGLAHIQLIGSGAEAVRGDELPESDGDTLLQSQGCAYAYVLLLRVAIGQQCP